MIPISFKENAQETVNFLYHQLLDIKLHQPNKKEYISNIREINLWCCQNICIDGEVFSFPKIIQADYNTLVKITKILDILNFPEKYIKPIKNLYNNRFPRKAFMESLGVTVCPYCNRNFINQASKRTMCDLDHFFSQTKYPILAVSFYNLIPVCHSCNHTKGEQSISYSPHDRSYCTDDLLTFGFYFKSNNFLSNEKDIAIEINTTKKIKDNINVLNLRDVYQIHSDIVQDCIKKAITFSPEYLDYLYYTYSDLFDSKEELYRTVLGNYIEQKSYGKRPLAKLTSDVLKELFETCYGIDL